MFETLESRELFSATLATTDLTTTTSATPTDPTIVVEADPSNGMPTGKRMHKPFVITTTIDKASPTLM